MDSFRDAFRADEKGFFSGRHNHATLTDNILLLAFGPDIDALAFHHFMQVNNTLPFYKTMVDIAKKVRYKYATSKTLLKVHHTVRGVELEMPWEAYWDVKVGSKFNFHSLEDVWLNG